MSPLGGLVENTLGPGNDFKAVFLNQSFKALLSKQCPQSAAIKRMSQLPLQTRELPCMRLGAPQFSPWVDRCKKARPDHSGGRYANLLENTHFFHRESSSSRSEAPKGLISPWRKNTSR